MGTRLGQNFLKHPEVAAKIALAAKLTAQDTVLEVGPGRGVLTAELLARAARVIAIEKDEKLADYLVGRFASEIVAKKLILVRGDALDFDPQKYKLKNNNYKIVANIPYYITGRLIRHFLENKIQPTSLTLLVQKEVAERIVAKPPHLNLLALSVQCYGTARISFKVGRGNFNPPPNVDSAVITIENISRNFFRRHKITEADLFAILHASFAHPRKQLAGNLLSYPYTKGNPLGKRGDDKEEILKIFGDNGISPTARAENLSLAEWATLVNALRKNNAD